ncbi:hypothetical protein B0H34DRAFT_809129 [Crassisporium funariophilum]|nr:hypothetical protein B0H34DRAFT_809129 [Crassisporium funariophilum]
MWAYFLSIVSAICPFLLFPLLFFSCSPPSFAPHKPKNDETRANAPLHRCLSVHNLCPSCGKSFNYFQAPKLPVGPYDATEHREVGLLKQLALAGALDAPQRQLNKVLREVDGWLRDHSDDSCMPLRSARAAMGRYAGFRDENEALKEEVRELRQRGVERERELERENSDLRANVTTLHHMITNLKHSLSLSHGSGGNGAGASGVDGVVPTSRNTQDCERDRGEGGERKRKGKSKALEEHQPTPPGRLGPSHSHSLVPVDSTLFAPSYPIHIQPPISPPPSSHPQTTQPQGQQGLQLHFEAMNQPLDVYALTYAYLREYSAGFVAGQEKAYRRMADDGQGGRDGRRQEERERRGKGEGRRPESGVSATGSQSQSGSGSGMEYEQAVVPSASTGDHGHRRAVPSSSGESRSNAPRQSSEAPTVRREKDASTGQPVFTNSRLASILDVDDQPLKKEKAGESEMGGESEIGGERGGGRRVVFRPLTTPMHTLTRQLERNELGEWEWEGHPNSPELDRRIWEMGEYRKAHVPPPTTAVLNATPSSNKATNKYIFGCKVKQVQK